MVEFVVVEGPVDEVQVVLDLTPVLSAMIEIVGGLGPGRAAALVGRTHHC